MLFRAVCFSSAWSIIPLLLHGCLRAVREVEQLNEFVDELPEVPRDKASADRVRRNALASG